MFGGKQDSDNKDNKPENFLGIFLEGLPEPHLEIFLEDSLEIFPRDHLEIPLGVHLEMEDQQGHLDHLNHLVGQMVIQKVTLK